MNRLFSAANSGLLISLILAVAGQPSIHPGNVVAHQMKRPVSVADGIGMTRLADTRYIAGLSSKGRVAQFSPDGRHFVVVLRKGNLEQNGNEYDMLLYRTNEALHSPLPRLLVAFLSTSNRPAITQVMWLADNGTILFLGERAGERAQLYSVECSSGRLQRLTNHPTNLTSFVSTPRGDRVVYAAEAPVSKVVDARSRHNGFHVTDERLTDLIEGHFGGDEHGYHQLFMLQTRTKERIELHPKGLIGSSNVKMWLDPHARYLVIQAECKGIPETWRDYEDKFLQSLARPTHRPSVHTGVYRYELIDTRTGTSKILLDAPIAPAQGGSEAAWSPDGQSVLLSHVFLPLNLEDPAEHAMRRAHTFLVEIAIPSRGVLKITDQDLRLLEWNPQTNTVVCDVGRIASLTGKSTPKLYFRKKEGKWLQVEIAKENVSTLPEIVLREDLNTPPHIVVVDSVNGREVPLIDLNPHFKDLAFAKVEEINWNDPLGNNITGGLYWPLNYVGGTKYPLIIQTHGFNPSKFWIDGPWTTAFAAQALAGKGFFVLQIPDPDWHNWNTPQEGRDAMAAYDGAIDYLAARGLIDVNHVGLIGFSRTCFYVTYTLTHSTHRFAAAVIADGIDAGYSQYIAFPTVTNEFEALNGDSPFGNGLSLWMERSPEFLVNKLQTPLLIQAIGRDSLLLEWHWFSGLSRLEKPMDMLYIPDGSHILEKPWDRRISQGSSVDWFCFWLTGQEDPDPLKAEQYALWGKMRTRH